VTSEDVLKGLSDLFIRRAIPGFVRTKVRRSGKSEHKTGWKKSVFLRKRAAL